MKSERGGREARTTRTAPDELDEELDAHFEGSVAMLVERGWREDDARAEVRRRFGDAERHRRTLRRMANRRSRHRRVRASRIAWAAGIGQAVRGIRGAPGLSAAVVVTLCLGIGVNGALFRVLDRLLLSPPPHISNPSDVIRLHQTARWGEGESRATDAFSYIDVTTLRSTSGGARLSGAMYSLPETLGEGDDAVRVRVARVDRAYFPLIGVRPVLGRAMLAEDHRMGMPPVALLSHALWTSRFGADPSVVGRTIRVADGRYEVIGVLPRGFFGAQAPASDVWLPLEPDAVVRWGAGWADDSNVLAFRILARLPAGTRAEAWTERQEERLRATTARRESPSDFLSLASSSLVPGDGPNPSPVITVSRWLAGVSLLVLIVACANAANLLLVQGERDRMSVAVRIALGAGPGAIRLELFLRTALLALAGAAAAIVAAILGGALLEELFLGALDLPVEGETPRLLLFLGAMGVVATLLTGLIPAVRQPQADVRSALGSGRRTTRTRGGLRQGLVVVQVALSTVLLMGAGLFVRSFRAAQSVDLGFDVDHLAMVRVERDRGSELSRDEAYAAVVEQVRSLPSVTHATRTIAVPFQLLYGLAATLPDQAADARIYVNGVGSDYFETMGITIRRGRPLTADDALPGAEPVAVVGARAAARLWPGEDPLGRCLQVGEAAGVCTRVIGVAAEHAGVSWTPEDFTDPTGLQAWVSLSHPEARAPSSVLVRLETPNEEVLNELRRAAALPGVRYVEVEPLSRLVGREMRSWRLGATVFSLFSLVALLVAALGLYSALAHEVAQRRREFGVRRALGAGRSSLITTSVSSALPLFGAGLLIGGAVAVLGATRLGPLLFRTDPYEPSVLAGAAAVLLICASAAVVLPAWRASVVDPREALSEE